MNPDDWQGQQNPAQPSGEGAPNLPPQNSNNSGPSVDEQMVPYSPAHKKNPYNKQQVGYPFRQHGDVQPENNAPSSKQAEANQLPQAAEPSEMAMPYPAQTPQLADANDTANNVQSTAPLANSVVDDDDFNSPGPVSLMAVLSMVFGIIAGPVGIVLGVLSIRKGVIRNERGVTIMGSVGAAMGIITSIALLLTIPKLLQDPGYSLLIDHNGTIIGNHYSLRVPKPLLQETERTNDQTVVYMQKDARSVPKVEVGVHGADLGVTSDNIKAVVDDFKNKGKLSQAVISTTETDLENVSYIQKVTLGDLSEYVVPNFADALIGNMDVTFKNGSKNTGKFVWYFADDGKIYSMYVYSTDKIWNKYSSIFQNTLLSLKVE